MPPRNKGIQPLHLAQAERCLNIRKAVVEPEFGHLITPRPVGRNRHLFPIARDAMAAQPPQPGGERSVIGQRDAAFARGYDFHRMKAENRDIAESAVANWQPFISSTDRMRSVFNSPESIFGGKPGNASHVNRLPGKMDRNDNFRQTARAGGNLQFFRKACHRHVECAGVNIHKINIRPAIARAIGACHKCVGRGPHKITSAHIQRQACNMQCRRGAVHSNGVFGAAIACHRILKFRNYRTLSQKIRAQNRRNRFNILIRYILAAIGNHSSAMSLNLRISAVERKCVLPPELYSNPRLTACPCSPREFCLKSFALE